MWGLYYGETKPKFKQSRQWYFAYWISERYWIDLLVDLTTFLLFGMATWKAFFAIIEPHCCRNWLNV